MNNSMIKAVIFDMDNTLIDFMKIKTSSVEAAINAMIHAGLKMDKKKAEEILYELYDEHGIEDQHIFQRFLERVNNKIDYKILSAGIVAYRKLQSGLLDPYPATFPTLVKIKEMGLKLAILSDAPSIKGWIRLREMKIADFFDVVVTFDDTKETKPNPAPFKKVLSMLNLKPEECLMVGDSPKRDMEGAKKAGIKTVFASYGATKDKKYKDADYTIKSVSEVIPILEKLK